MSLCGIHDKAMLFVRKNRKTDVTELKYPKIVILNREESGEEKVHRNSPKFKVRRAWRCIRIGKDDLEKTLESIHEDEKFKKLESRDEFMGWNEMKDNFLNEKICIYKKNYPDCLETNSKNNTAIISTTLHIASGRIMFSIHPARVVIGTVECFYNMTEEDKAVAFSSAGI